MSIDNLPQPIKDAIINENNFDDYEAMPNNFGITEVLYCLRKKYYQKTLPKKPINLETAVNYHRGNVWDRDFCSKFKRNQVRSTYRCHTVPIAVSGKFDFLDENNVITDLKSPGDLYYVEREGKPNSHYEKQVRFYCYTNAIPRGQVMYWNGGPKCIKYSVEITDEKCEELINEIEARVCILYNSLQNSQAPNITTFPPEDWECKKCDWITECKNEV